MKKVKETKSTLMAFYQGGTKFRAALTMTIDEVEKEIAAAKMYNRPARLESSNPDPEINDEFLYFMPSTPLFYNISTAVQKSQIAIVPAGAV